MSSTFSRTLTISNTVGELNKTVTLSTSDRDITHEDLTRLAHLALNNDEVTKVKGVSIKLKVSGPEKRSLVGEMKNDPFTEVLVGVFGYSPTAAEREQREFEETKKFNDELDRRTSEMFCPALEWYLAKVAHVVKSDEGWAHVQKTGAREIAKGWAHVQMLQEHIRKLEKVNEERNGLLKSQGDELNKLQQLMGERARAYEAKISELHESKNMMRVANETLYKEKCELNDKTVELSNALDRELAGLRNKNMSLVNRIKVANKLIEEISRVL